MTPRGRAWLAIVDRESPDVLVLACSVSAGGGLEVAQRISGDGSALSPREREVLRLTARFSNLEIGERLFVSPKTIHTYRSRIMSKLEIRRRSELVDYAIHHGLME